VRLSLASPAAVYTQSGTTGPNAGLDSGREEEPLLGDLAGPQAVERHLVHLHALAVVLVGHVHDEADGELVAVHVRALDLHVVDIVVLRPPLALGAGGALAASLPLVAHRFDAQYVLGPVFLAGLAELTLPAQRHQVLRDFLRVHRLPPFAAAATSLGRRCDRNWQESRPPDGDLTKLTSLRSRRPDRDACEPRAGCGLAALRGATLRMSAS